MKTISIYSMKGGVGKTTTAVNFAYLAAENRIKTLLVDLDPQGSASFYYKIEAKKKASATKLLKKKKSLDDMIRSTDYEYLDMLPADFSFRKFDLLLNGLKRSKSRLYGILKKAKKNYDLVIIDAPPNITLLSENIFTASDYLFVPVVPTTLSIVSLDKLLQFLKKSNYNHKKVFAFFSMVEKRKMLHREIMADFKQRKMQILNNAIPYAADIEKMGLHREPIFEYIGDTEAVQAYKELWQEIITVINNRSEFSG